MSDVVELKFSVNKQDGCILYKVKLSRLGIGIDVGGDSNDSSCRLGTEIEHDLHWALVKMQTININ